MSSVSTYYFTSNANKEGEADVSKAFRHLWIHIGSVALGSLIMAVIKVIKDAFDSSGDKENCCTKIVFAVISKILGFAEGVLEGLSNIGYAFMAVSGQPFITSVLNGFLLNLKHAATFFIVSILAKTFTSTGVFLVTVSNTALAWVIMKYISLDTENLTVGGTILILVIDFFLSWLTAKIFLG
jgi:hypothetical protein